MTKNTQQQTDFEDAIRLIESLELPQLERLQAILAVQAKGRKWDAIDGAHARIRKIEAEAWVSREVHPALNEVLPTPPAPAEKTTRLTFDCPVELHRIIKSSCATRGTKINQEVIALLREHYKP